MENEIKVKELCEKIEKMSEALKENTHDLLYENVLLELLDLKLSGIFIQFKGMDLHRIRLNNEKNVPFTKIEEIYYPPSEFVNYFGRVNRPQQSMFYCSEGIGICELELLHDYLLKNEIGHERLATYSQWEIKKELNLLILAIAPSNREYVNGFTIRNECFNFVKTEPEGAKVNYSNLYKLTSEFFLKNAKINHNVYIICSAISNLLTLYFPNIDGFIYPSVQGNTGYNFVLRPHVLDEKMIIPKKELEMKKWVITDKNNMTIDSTFHKAGIINEQKIIWEN